MKEDIFTRRTSASATFRVCPMQYILSLYYTKLKGPVHVPVLVYLCLAVVQSIERRDASAQFFLTDVNDLEMAFQNSL